MTEALSHLWRQEPRVVGDDIVLSSVFEGPRTGRSELWYKIPGSSQSLITNHFDSFVVANIFLIMQEGGLCHVHENVTFTLLRNLTEFQTAWASWRPEKYRFAQIVADGMAECAAPPAQSCIAAFSGGIDSTFTMFRHRLDKCEQHWRRNIEAGVFVHGFDIPLSQEDAFLRACERMRDTLETVGCNLITMSTNLQALNIEWDDTHIAGIASSLMLLSGRYSEGLIASGSSYHKLLIPWGSNPITDHLLSSKHFQIVHDGAGYTRIQKRENIRAWPEGFHNMRICFSAEKRDENCGQCSKCLTDILHMRILQKEIPKSFPHTSDSAIKNLQVRNDGELNGFDSLVASARKRGISDNWVNILDTRVRQLKAERRASDKNSLQASSSWLGRLFR
jgi:hypothetical protein